MHKHRVGGREFEIDFVVQSGAASRPHNQDESIRTFHANQFRGPMKRLMQNSTASADYVAARSPSPAQSNMLGAQRKNCRSVGKHSPPRE
jgi:hypothetical protein